MANRKTKIYRSKDLQGDQNPNLTDFEILDLWYDPAIAVDKNNLNLLKANSSFKYSKKLVNFQTQSNKEDSITISVSTVN